MKRTAVVEHSDGLFAWSLDVGEHRCSFPRCSSPSVAVSRDRPRSTEYYHRRARGRWWCVDHLAGINRFVRSGRVWWRVTPGMALEDLSFPWPPPRWRS